MNLVASYKGAQTRRLIIRHHAHPQLDMAHRYAVSMTESTLSGSILLAHHHRRVPILSSPRATSHQDNGINSCAICQHPPTFSMWL